MIKLFTLKNLSDFSSDAVYKIGLALEQCGLRQEQTVEFDSYDQLYFETIVALEKGDHIVVAAENEDYNGFKRELISKLLLEEYSSEEIVNVIERNAGEDISEIDITGHSLVARDSMCHLSRDGLYSGFTCKALFGTVSCVPLDFMRIDTVIEGLKQDIIASSENNSATTVVMPEFDLYPHVSDVVAALRSIDSTMALSTGEATMWIYNYYDKVEGFNDTLRFVEVVEDGDGEEITAESESVKIIRHAREAMLNADADFGAAVSEIYSTVNDRGQTVYFAYAAVVDKSAAKAKKINTTNPEDLALILPHTVTVLTELVKNRVNVILAKRTAPEAETQAEVAPAASATGKISKNMLIFGIVVIAVAIISPIIMVALFFSGNGTTQPSQDPAPYVDATGQSSTSEQTTNSPIIIPSGNLGNVTEPSVGEIYVTTTQNTVSSTSGTFTFDVFGHGHGVGMSQEGADWLARSQGWTWTQILAHYYYCQDQKGQILHGDAFPDTISYGGTAYQTREFLASVLEAEMGSGFHAEALKAQFVAIYTFAKYYNFDLKKDACAILGSGRTPSDAVYAVVDEMMGIGAYIAYDGECALTPFHAFSAGKTTSYYNVWGKGVSKDIPYLSGARLSYGDTLETDYRTSYTISSDGFKNLVKATTGVELTGDPATWVSVISHDGCISDQVGYVTTIRVGDTTYSGNDFRTSIMEGRINSHCFYITYTPDA